MTNTSLVCIGGPLDGVRLIKPRYLKEFWTLKIEKQKVRYRMESFTFGTFCFNVWVCQDITDREAIAKVFDAYQP